MLKINVDERESGKTAREKLRIAEKPQPECEKKLICIKDV